MFSSTIGVGEVVIGSDVEDVAVVVATFNVVCTDHSMFLLILLPKMLKKLLLLVLMIFLLFLIKIVMLQIMIIMRVVKKRSKKKTYLTIFGS